MYYDNEFFQTPEHAYQAAKTLVPEERETIKKAETPRAARNLGQKVTLREDWDDIKLEVMSDITWDKFTRHTELKDRLLATGKALLIEGNTWGDKFWGMCGGEGENNLGKILMQVRESLNVPSDRSQWKRLR